MVCRAWLNPRAADHLDLAFILFASIVSSMNAERQRLIEDEQRGELEALGALFG